MATVRRRIRPVRSPELVFLSTFAVVTLLAVYNFGRRYAEHDASGQASLVLRALQDTDQECRLVNDVRDVTDQCAFIRKNCPDEEAGLISYLQLYYCSLPTAKPLAFFILVAWISVLFSTIGVAASDFLCVNLSTIATILGMSESLTGVTFLAFGNGSPDVFSTFAAMKSNSGSLAVGELVGAAGFITAVVSGSMAITKPFRVGRKSFVRDVSFFAVAASFSLVFLYDGRLKLWECIAMVAFYVFYVIFVVVWHWWLQRHRRIRLAETAARLHHHIPDQQELEDPQIDIDEESRPAGERSPLLHGSSSASIPTLITPGSPAWLDRGDRDDDDDDDETRDRTLAGLQSNMRVSRARGRDRRNTITPIRPSLLGAIEFRSVLSALEKKATSGQVIGLRRYSDDGLQENPQASYFSHMSQPHLAVTSPEDARLDIVGGRARAVSTNDAAGVQVSEDLLSSARGTPDTAIYSPAGRQSSTSSHRRIQSELLSTDYLAPSYGSNLSSSPSPMSPSLSPRPGDTNAHGLLAAPSTAAGGFQKPNYGNANHDRRPSPMVSPNMDVPVIRLPDPEHRKSPVADQFASPGSTPTSTRRSSIRLPPPRMSLEPGAQHSLSKDDVECSPDVRRFKWWPYKYLPPPQTVIFTLFPGLSEWHDRGFFAKVAVIATLPAVFLLTITLPVVDPSGEDDDRRDEVYTAATNLAPDTPATVPIDGYSNGAGNHPHSVALSRRNTDHNKDVGADFEPVPHQKEWNRWLVILQLFTAPIFVVLIIWANLDEGHNTKELLLLVLGCLVFSLIGLLFLLRTTSADHEPKYRPILCFLGFAVAIAWISTIANEVVGVLKAIGVIVDMSDAILGLTIFAVGNSLGDLVADITIARLGYPTMALSACFGGPMLNILLGIGLGGMYMTISRGQHKHHKHPNQPIHYKPYEIEVSTTLMISGITLLITLAGLLIFVPLNGWRMDRKIGIGLILVWVASTTLNVVVEVVGLGTEGAHTVY